MDNDRLGSWGTLRVEIGPWEYVYHDDWLFETVKSVVNGD